MKKIFVLLVIGLKLLASVVEVPLIEVNNEKNIAKIKVEKIDVGMSGYIIKKLSPQHNVVIGAIVVKDFDLNTHIATLKILENKEYVNDSLPYINAKIKKGDSVFLAFGYSRALLVAPNEDIYYSIIKRLNIGWIHPDIFAAFLSMNGHPTPLVTDFQEFSHLSAVGLLFIYLDKKLYTVDMSSFKILNISEAPLQTEGEKVPFYSRIEKIDANWFGDGNEYMKEYKKHYYEILVKNNPLNKDLYNIIKNLDTRYNILLENFKIKENK